MNSYCTIKNQLSDSQCNYSAQLTAAQRLNRENKWAKSNTGCYNKIICIEFYTEKHKSNQRKSNVSCSLNKNVFKNIQMEKKKWNSLEGGVESEMLFTWHAHESGSLISKAMNNAALFSLSETKKMHLTSEISERDRTKRERERARPLPAEHTIKANVFLFLTRF